MGLINGIGHDLSLLPRPGGYLWRCTPLLSSIAWSRGCTSKGQVLCSSYLHSADEVSTIWKSLKANWRVPFIIFPGLRPKRTLRLVLWTAEEQGGIGASQYYEQHKVKSQDVRNTYTCNITVNQKHWFLHWLFKSSGIVYLKVLGPLWQADSGKYPVLWVRASWWNEGALLFPHGPRKLASRVLPFS